MSGDVRSGFPKRRALGLAVVGGKAGPGDGGQTFNLPKGVDMELLGVRFTLVTDVNPAARMPFLQVSFNNAAVLDVASLNSQDAGISGQWSFVPYLGEEVNLGTRHSVCMGRVWIPADGGLTLLYDNGQAGDVTSNLFAIVRIAQFPERG